MDFTEIIGFIIVLFVFLVPLLRKLLIDKKRVEQQKEEEEEAVFDEEEEEIPVKPSPLLSPTPVYTPARTMKSDYEFEFNLEEREFLSKITSRKLKIDSPPEFRERIVSEEFILETLQKKRKKIPIASIIRKQGPEWTMIILSEILNKKFE